MTKKLLLADDSVTIQKVIGIIFATEDYELQVCDDGNDALEKALSEYPDLVIADISMPGKDGFELCQAIKSDARLEHTSVLLLPGTFEHFDESQAEAVGADGWISKPFESQALLDKVAQLLEAEPVRLGAGGESASEEVVDFSAEEIEEEPLEEVDELQESTVDEAVLGLDEVEEVEPPSLAAPAEEESAEDIWDAVSFEEEDLQPAEDLSSAVGTDVLEEFAAADEVADFAAEEESAPADFSQPEEEPLELTDAGGEFATEEPLEFDAGEEEPLELEEEAVLAAEEEPVSVEEFVAEEPVSAVESVAAPAFAVEEEGLPVVEAEEESFEEDEEILDLAEDDILEEEPLGAVEEFAAQPVAELSEEPLDLVEEEVVEEVEQPFLAEPEAAAEEEVAPEPVTEELVDEAAAEFTPEPVVEPVADTEELAYESAEAELEPVAELAEVPPVERAEQQLRELSEDELKDVVSRVAGPIVEKLAGEMLEQVVWEVVPDLAESMIHEEIRKIREGAAE